MLQGENRAGRLLKEFRKLVNQLFMPMPEIRWQKVSGPGPQIVVQHANGSFKPLCLEKNQNLVLKTQLNLPSDLLDVPIEGSSLSCLIFGIHPVQLICDRRKVFDDKVPLVAAGPAMFRLKDKIIPSKPLELELALFGSDNQMVPWFGLQFFVSCLYDLFEEFDLVWAQLYLCHHIAESQAEKNAVAKALDIVSEMLQQDTLPKKRLFLKQIQTQLMPMRDKLRSVKVYLIGHSHIDMNWLWRWPDTVATVRRDFRSVLQLMDEFPELTFSHSQPATYEIIRQYEPDLFSKVLAHIQKGRWEILTSQWVEADANLISGESHIGQIQQAALYNRTVLNSQPRIFHAPDTFGFPANLPQLLKQSDFLAIYHHRCNPGGLNNWPVYAWQGLDGSFVTALSTQSYNQWLVAGWIALAVVHAWKQGLDRVLYFHGIGDHGGGPTRQGIQNLYRMRQSELWPDCFFSTITEFYQELQSSGKLDNLRSYQGDLNAIFEGCYTTHADTKRYNRLSEKMFYDANVLTVLAGVNQNPKLQAVQQKILFHQFHDIICGCAIGETYQDQAQAFRDISKSLNDIQQQALKIICQGDKNAFWLVNTLPWPRSEWVELDIENADACILWPDGSVIETQRTCDGKIGFFASVESLSAICCRMIEGQQPQMTASSLIVEETYAPTDILMKNPFLDLDTNRPYWKVENNHYCAWIRKDNGVIVSFYLKSAQRDLVWYGMTRPSDYIHTARPDLALNVLQYMEEKPHSNSAWQIHEVACERSLISGARTELIEHGPLRAALNTRHTLENSSISQRIIFYRDLPYIEFHTDIEWLEKGNAQRGVPGLKVSFNGNLPACQGWFETPFGASKHPGCGQEIPALQWALVENSTQGFAVFNEDKHGYDMLGSRLRLSLLRSAYEPDPSSDIGNHHIRYAFYPYVGVWQENQIPRKARQFNHPLLVYRSSKESDTIVQKQIENFPISDIFASHNVVMSCMKHADKKGGVILRFYESCGQPGTVHLNFSQDIRVYETNILEQIVASIDMVDRKVLAELSPWQVKTLLVQNI